MRWAGNGELAIPAVRPITVWLVLVLGFDVAVQVIRLQQTDPAAWLFWDYTSRLGALILLAIDPDVRAMAFRRERLQISLAIVINWGLLLIPIGWGAVIAGHIWTAFLPDMRLGFYPRPEGWLRIFDLTFGIALVAWHEEIVFRRAMRLALQGLGDGRAMILVSGVLFGAYHWWTGIPNMVFAGLFGLVFMRVYCRSGALWPIMVIHYLADFWAFI
jgi:membrane protease YdiL (CAAX protease family)